MVKSQSKGRFSNWIYYEVHTAKVQQWINIRFTFWSERISFEAPGAAFNQRATHKGLSKEQVHYPS